VVLQAIGCIGRPGPTTAAPSEESDCQARTGTFVDHRIPELGRAPGVIRKATKAKGFPIGFIVQVRIRVFLRIKPAQAVLIHVVVKRISCTREDECREVLGIHPAIPYVRPTKRTPFRPVIVPFDHWGTIGCSHQSRNRRSRVALQLKDVGISDPIDPNQFPPLRYSFDSSGIQAYTPTDMQTDIQKINDVEFELEIRATSDDLTDRQKATTYTHRALAVRGALLENDKVRRCVLALLLHEKVRADGLTVRHDANTTDLHAEKAEGFVSSVREALRQRLAELDPFAGDYIIETATAYRRLMDLPDAQLVALIDVLAVHSVIAHLHRPTELVALLAGDLGVNVRRYWRPDAAWLAGFKKIQLAHLIGQLRGPVYEGPALKRKKSELVEELAGLFTDAAEGRLDDPALIERVNPWLPANLRHEQPEEADRCDVETVSHAA